MNVWALGGRFNYVIDYEVYDTQVIVRILMSRLNKNGRSVWARTTVTICTRRI